GSAFTLKLSVIGLNDMPIDSYTDPQLTTVSYPTAYMTKIETELALQGAAGTLDITAPHCFMPTLVRRQSVAWRQNAVLITN
ncbi:substrate-binding domain-containing protein, partial [Salmonella enterica]|uniref:substrate-binding domain-containing protein n=1 Tax=Salmonella enterica TaxID=28901 RepID=UPI002ADEB85A